MSFHFYWSIDSGYPRMVGGHVHSELVAIRQAIIPCVSRERPTICQLLGTAGGTDITWRYARPIPCLGTCWRGSWLALTVSVGECPPRSRDRNLWQTLLARDRSLVVAPEACPCAAALQREHRRGRGCDLQRLGGGDGCGGGVDWAGVEVTSAVFLLWWAGGSIPLWGGRGSAS